MGDRKYRHRGYMDSGGEEPSRRRGAGEGAPPRLEGAPRGRSAGLDKDLAVSCKRCGQNVRGIEEITPDSTCPGCGSPLHACLQCKHFDPAARWECSRNAGIPARVADKKAANSCELFSAAASFDLTGRRPEASAGDARKAFDALFKK
jgi:hypothetical protein